MPQNVFPDFTGNPLNIHGTRRLALAGDLYQPRPGSFVRDGGGAGVENEDPDAPPTTGQRFAVSGEDELATQEREFNLTGAYNFSLVNDENPLFKVIGSSGQIVLGQYGEGIFEDEPAWLLGVDALGNLIEVDPGDIGGGGGSGPGDVMRFGYSGEDDTAGENRAFALDQYSLTLSSGFTNHSGLFNVLLNGTSDDDNEHGAAYFVNTMAGSGFVTNIGASGSASGGFDNIGLKGFGGAGGGYGIGVLGNGEDIGVWGNGNDIAIFGVSQGGVGGFFTRIESNNDSVFTIVGLDRQALSGLGADGIGGSMDFQLTMSGGGGAISNRLISILTNSAALTLESQFKIAGVTAGAPVDQLIIDGNGVITLPQGLSDYADDTAAAGGTPVIPVNGLYRTASNIKIRVA